MEEINFTKDSIDVVNSYLARRLTHLEEDGLQDGYCYPRVLQFRFSLMKLLDFLEKTNKDVITIKLEE